MPNLIWFREDLRVDDQSALYHACQQSQDGVIGLFVLTPQTWKAHDMAPCRVAFLLQGLNELQRQLQKLNIPLYFLTLQTFEETPKALAELCQFWKIKAVYANQLFEVNEQRRDSLVENILTELGIHWILHHDQTVIEPSMLKTQQNQNYTVFTPYKKAWVARLKSQGIPALLPKPKVQTIRHLPLPTHLPLLSQVPDALPNWHSTIDSKHWPAGEEVALSRLNAFMETTIYHYDKQRDYPALEATSQLSPYLTAGMLSPRRVLHSLIHQNQGALDIGAHGLLTWLNELIWREFYKMILYCFPRVSMHQPFKMNTRHLVWHENIEHLERWQQGLTGFPIVDASMRQLKQTGWMHNRCRMITAMFLSKLLWLDWRLGERWFMQSLIDGDLALNNGGWQWSASTGNDAVPYFRIFNPLLQSQKYDPDGHYIRRYCPELSDFDSKSIHAPYLYNPSLAVKMDYPKPIIDYVSARAYAISAFKSLT